MRLISMHRLMGAILILPMVAWAITGTIFFFKPGYSAAYERLSIKTLPLQEVSPIVVQPDWLEYHVLHTVLGHHLLVRTASGRQHLRLPEAEVWPVPDEAQLRQLFEDAIGSNPRYGALTSIEGTTAHTETGVNIDLNWNQLSLYQSGRDTRRIDVFYKIHYLQWTGHKMVDRVLGMVGLCLVLGMALTGTRLLFR